MAAIVALWPFGMLLALLVLGRRRQATTTLLAAACVVPVLAMFALGSVKRDLFDARYFSGAIALSVVLLARMLTATIRRRVALVLSCAVLVGGLSVALFDQQTNGANPRRYSFREAVRLINRQSKPGDRVLYAPGDLGTVIGYYDRGPYTLNTLSTASSALTPRSGRIFVLTSARLMAPGEATKTGDTLVQLGQARHLAGQVQFDNVTVWEFS
jgi:hypothetical protein